MCIRDRILSSSTCVGLRYGYNIHNSGFSRQMVCVLRYFCSLRVTPLDWDTDLPVSLLLCLHRSFLSRLTLSFCVPTFLIYRSTGISTCCPDVYKRQILCFANDFVLITKTAYECKHSMQFC